MIQPSSTTQVFDDHCALRRYLIDEQFMSRTAAGVYWRAGGTVSQRRRLTLSASGAPVSAKSPENQAQIL